MLFCETKSRVAKLSIIKYIPVKLFKKNTQIYFINSIANKAFHNLLLLHLYIHYCMKIFASIMLYIKVIGLILVFRCYSKQTLQYIQQQSFAREEL